MPEVLINPVLTGPAQPAGSVAGSGRMADSSEFNQLLTRIMAKPDEAQSSESASLPPPDKHVAGQFMLSELPAEILEQLQLAASLVPEGETLDVDTETESVPEFDSDPGLQSLVLGFQMHPSVLPVQQFAGEGLMPDALSASPGIEGLSEEGVETALTGGTVQPLPGGNPGDLMEQKTAGAEAMKVATADGAGITQMAEKAAGTAVSDQIAEANSGAVNASIQMAERRIFGVAVQPLQSLTSRSRPGQAVQPVPIAIEPDKTPKYQVSVAPVLQQQLAGEAVTAELENMEESPVFPDVAAVSELKPYPESGAGLFSSADANGGNAEMVLDTGFNTVLARETRQPAEAGETVRQSGTTFPVTRETVFNQIVEKARIMAGNGHSEMELDLKPDHLGKIQLRVSLENQLISARFIAESEQVKAILETNLADLKRQLQENGVNVHQLMVSIGSESKDPSLNQHSFSHHQQNQPQAGGKWSTVYDEAEPTGNTARQISESVIDLIA